MNRTLLAVCAALTFSLAACGSEGTASEPVEVAATSVAATETGVTWKYLQTEYAGLLNSANCDTKSSLVATCQGLRTAQVESFQRDATELAPSKARSDLLGTIEDYLSDDKEFDSAMCLAKAGDVSCTITMTTMNISSDLMKTIVDREAAK